MPNQLLQTISNYKAVVFDMDGTLVDLGVDWDELKRVLHQTVFQKHNTGFEFKRLNKNLLEAKERLGDEVYGELLKIVSQFEMKEENYVPNVGLLGYINQAKDQKIAIYSMNTQQAIENVIGKYLARRPDYVISKESCIEPKPTSKDLVKLLEMWDINRDEVIYVGNSEKDKISGEMAKIKTIIITMDNHGAYSISLGDIVHV